MMISFKRNASRGALLVGTLMMVAVVVLALFMQGDRGEPVDAVQAVTGMVGVCDGPFDENRSIQPVYEWIEDPNTGVWSVRITPDSTIRDEAAALGFSGEPVEVGWQGYYEFRLHVSNNGRRGTTLIEQKTFSVSLPSVQYAVTRVVGRNMNSLHYEFAFVIRHNGADQCRIEANHDGAAPNGLRVYLLQEPTNTPTRYYPPTNTPDCPSQALAQETIDAVGMWARAYPSGGGWKVEVWWERFYVDPDALYPVAVTQYRVGIPGLIANLRKQSSQPFYRYTTDWRGGVPAQGQTYEARLSVIGRQNCVIGERVVDFTIPVGDDVPINACEVDGPVEVVTWGYWNSSGDLDAYVRFGLVDWAEYYLVHFRHDDIVKIVPTSEQLAAGEVIFARNGSYDSPQGQNGYVVSVQPMSSTCMGTLVTVNCRQETCVQLSPLTPAPTLSSIGVCSGLAQPVAVISATVGADGQHAASVEVVSNSVVSHYDLKTVYRGGAAVDRRVTSYEAQSSISLGMYQGPENLGEYWLMTVQARGWDDNLGCGGPWGPISVMRLEGGGSGVSPGQPGTTPQPGSTPGQPGTTPRPTPTRVQVVPGDPIDWPDPVDFRTWDDRNPANDSGHYGWCYSGRYNDKMDDYYARVNEFASAYEQVLRDAGVTKIRKEVNDAVDEAFEDPEEFCSRVGFFGFIRFALGWLSGVVFALLAVSGLILILVRSAGGDSPNTQVWVKQVFVGLAVATVVVAVVWIVFEILVGVLFGVGVDAIPQATTGGVIAPAWRGVTGLSSWFLPGRTG